MHMLTFELAAMVMSSGLAFFFFFNDTATTEIYTLSLHDALPISGTRCGHQSAGRPGVGHPRGRASPAWRPRVVRRPRSEEHTSELQSLRHLVCRLLLEKTTGTQHTQRPILVRLPVPPPRPYPTAS